MSEPEFTWTISALIELLQQVLADQGNLQLAVDLPENGGRGVMPYSSVTGELNILTSSDKVRRLYL